MNTSTKYRLAFTAALATAAAAIAAALAVAGVPPPAEAQNQLQSCTATAQQPNENPLNPPPPAPPSPFVLTGPVVVPNTVAAQLAGLEIEVRIGNPGSECIAATVTIGQFGLSNAPTTIPGHYQAIIEAVPSQQAGQTISFYLEDGTKAQQTETYVHYSGYLGESCLRKASPNDPIARPTAQCVRSGPQNSWGYVSRYQELTFPNLPLPPPAPVIRAHTFSGTAFSPMQSGGLDGVNIFARVGTYTTPEPVLIRDGTYRITVNPNNAAAIGQPVSFFYEGAPEAAALWITRPQPLFTPGATSVVVLDFPGEPPAATNPEPATPMTFAPQIYRGTVASLSAAGGLTNIAVEARIGSDYVSDPATVGSDSSYLLLISPAASAAAALVNEQIEFNIVGMPTVKAFQVRQYTGVSTTEELNLVFPMGAAGGGGCNVFGSVSASNVSISNLLLLAVPALVVVGLRLNLRRGKRQG